MGKLVSEEFKETHKRSWGQQNPTRVDIITRIAEAVSTPRRWEKGLEKLRDAGTYIGGPEDIGPLLLRVVNQDIEAEEAEAIKEQLWKHFRKDILRASTFGIPQWRKDRLLEEDLEGVR